MDIKEIIEAAKRRRANELRPLTPEEEVQLSEFLKDLKERNDKKRGR